MAALSPSRLREIEEQAIIAFNSAIEQGFISRYSSADEVLGNSFEILEFMPDYDINDLNDDEYNWAEGVLVSQLS